MSNKICYFELITPDIKRSSTFYSGVFGWAVTPSGEDYAMVDAGGGLEGGFSPAMPGIASGVCIYIQVDDIEAALKSIISAGGQQVLAKTKISDEYGYYALFSDPAGNVIGLWNKS
jgi:predicted enzyme related to lactoylglutathione lyase